MMNKGKIVLLVLVGVVFSFSYASAQKMKFVTAIRMYAPYILTMGAAEEKGLWKQNGLDAEWFPFKGGSAMRQAVAAGRINVGFTSASGLFIAANGGLPVLAVAQVVARAGYVMWVRTASKIKKVEDLKGKKIGISRIGGMGHMYSLIILKSLGLEKQVKFVGTRGIRESMAMLKVGSIDATVRSYFSFIRLKVANEVRELALVDDYLPKKWAASMVFVRRPFLLSNRDKVARTVKTVIQAVNFIADNRTWAIEKLKRDFKYSDEAATLAYRMLNFRRDGKIDVEGVKNVRNLLIKYGIVKKEKIPPLHELYTLDFTG